MHGVRNDDEKAYAGKHWGCGVWSVSKRVFLRFWHGNGGGWLVASGIQTLQLCSSFCGAPQPVEAVTHVLPHRQTRFETQLSTRLAAGVDAMLQHCQQTKPSQTKQSLHCSSVFSAVRLQLLHLVSLRKTWGGNCMQLSSHFCIFRPCLPSCSSTATTDQARIATPRPHAHPTLH